jgi:hypothetical protein
MNSSSANRIYPPLPKPAHVEYQQGFVHDIEHPYFSAEQMHAFLDDGYSMRAQVAPAVQHSDDAAVDALAALMKSKLAKQRAKGYAGWDTSECTQQHLTNLLRTHVDKGDLIDVANFCAFLSARGEGIAAPQPAAASFDLDADLARTIDQRDTAEGWADGLAALIGKHFGENIGEHSSAHNPWQEAKDIIETAAPYQAATLEVLRSFAEGRIQHINKGLCPDHIAGHGSRDPECAICRALDQQGGV